MAKSITALLMLSTSLALCTTATSSPILDDLFRGFVHDSQLANEPAKDSTVVKRRIFEENPDAQLKQVSLQSLIGDVEDSLFQTALSVSSVANNHDAVVPEVKPELLTTLDRTVKKRETSNKEIEKVERADDKGVQFVTTTEAVPESKSILLQTTQKVPANNGVPAHILIDRVAVQPHQGGLPIIPAFQVYQTKVISATFKDSNTNAADNTNADSNTGTTKISIAQSTNAGSVPVITIATTNPKEGKQQTKIGVVTTTTQEIHSQAPTNPIDSASAVSTTTTATTSTAKQPLVQLKEAEEQLKEKVAEIEAEPVILTARV